MAIVKYISLVLFLPFLLYCSCLNAQNDSSKVILTVVRNDNQNPYYRYEIDTLIKDSLIDLKQTRIDLYFTKYCFRFPYYMPTYSTFKNQYQEKECNWDIYPNYVKCYQYDSLNRVTRMQVEGSGTKGYWYYKYNSLDQIVEIRRENHVITIKYNTNGTISEIWDDGGDLRKQFFFYYRRPE